MIWNMHKVLARFPDENVLISELIIVLLLTILSLSACHSIEQQEVASLDESTVENISTNNFENTSEDDALKPTLGQNHEIRDLSYEIEHDDGFTSKVTFTGENLSINGDELTGTLTNAKVLLYDRSGKLVKALSYTGDDVIVDLDANLLPKRFDNLSKAITELIGNDGTTSRYGHFGENLSSDGDGNISGNMGRWQEIVEDPDGHVNQVTIRDYSDDVISTTIYHGQDMIVTFDDDQKVSDVSEEDSQEQTTIPRHGDGTSAQTEGDRSQSGDNDEESGKDEPESAGNYYDASHRSSSSDNLAGAGTSTPEEDAEREVQRKADAQYAGNGKYKYLSEEEQRALAEQMYLRRQ